MEISIKVKRDAAEWLCRLLEMNENGFIQQSVNKGLTREMQHEAELQAVYCLMLSNKIKNLLLANT